MADQRYGLTGHGRGQGRWALGLGLPLLLAVGCQQAPAVPTRSLQIHQDWVLRSPVVSVGDYRASTVA
ncbi:hypothetical protein XM38_022330 [Halomicronema hongdechloris C2206]|uniref:Uncharacterized protein n=1 Tax=Halomicronema hongdechloris C2206 TaxID=1641165 RepID=A0A1Z3HLV3_9CYAN|nr:hypothetical protein [Halomicronema hongdechloris]ASC71281.1 hypothetical protein XM38_022330 [Halomicronema hongdechloris C2206]